MLRLARRARSEARLSKQDLPWLVGAIFFGGVLGPVLLMSGLLYTPASTVSLLLNLEGVFTALLAWFVFRENFDRRIAIGMGLIVTGGMVLGWSSGGFVFPVHSLAVAGACFCWGIDNNLTQRVSGSDPFQIAAYKGAVAGAVNVTLALLLGANIPAFAIIGNALLLGFFGYGLSLALFVYSLRHIGTARTGAYFSLAPFVGAVVSLFMLSEPLSVRLLIAGSFMGIGVWLHLTEKHEHKHEHAYMEHIHSHIHDEHHNHTHTTEALPTGYHTHLHMHARLTHKHTHYPDIHHRHEHN
jgi:drug/metabolite transporter (DMT)-like permease